MVLSLHFNLRSISRSFCMVSVSASFFCIWIRFDFVLKHSLVLRILSSQSSCLSLGSYGICRHVPPQWTMTQVSLCWMGRDSSPAGLAGCPCQASVDGQEVAQWLARTHKIPRSVHSTSKTNTTKQKSSIKVQMYSRHSVWIHWSCIIFLSMLQCPDSFCQCYNVPTALIFVVLKPRYWSLQFFSFIRLF